MRDEETVDGGFESVEAFQLGLPEDLGVDRERRFTVVRPLAANRDHVVFSADKRICTCQ